MNGATATVLKPSTPANIHFVNKYEKLSHLYFVSTYEFYIVGKCFRDENI